MTVRKELSQQYCYLALPVIIFFGYTIAFIYRLPYLVIFFIFGIMPKLDEWLSHDWVNPEREEIIELEKMQGFRAMLYITLLLDWAAIMIASKKLSDLPWYDLLPLLAIVLLACLNEFLDSSRTHSQG
jgi:hypothetical protein